VVTGLIAAPHYGPGNWGTVADLHGEEATICAFSPTLADALSSLTAAPLAKPPMAIKVL